MCFYGSCKPALFTDEFVVKNYITQNSAHKIPPIMVSKLCQKKSAHSHEALQMISLSLAVLSKCICIFCIYFIVCNVHSWLVWFMAYDGLKTV